MTVITIDERDFEIGEPNALHLVRIAAVVGKVGTRAERVAENLGRTLIAQVSSDGNEKAPDLSGAIFPFLAALTSDDLLDLMAALLQFDDEQEGVRWLRKHPPKLAHVVRVVALNLENVGGIVEAIQNFTAILGGMNLAGMMVQSAGETG